MKHYGFFRSSASYRLRIGTNLKGLAVDYVPVHLSKNGGEQHLPDFVKLNPQHLVPVLEAVAKTGKPLLILAEEVEGEALATLVVNKNRGVLQVAAVRAPGFGDRRKAMLADIATLTGAQGIALGARTVGIMGNDDDLTEAIHDASVRAGEQMWPMPQPEELRAHFDSHSRFDLSDGDRIVVRRYRHTIRLLHPAGHDYYRMLREKLHWTELY